MHFKLYLGLKQKKDCYPEPEDISELISALASRIQDKDTSFLFWSSDDELTKMVVFKDGIFTRKWNRNTPVI